MSVSATGSANALSGYSLLAAPKDTKSSSVEKEFLEYAKMSPIERMRQNILKQMGLTEEALSSMPTEERQAIEDQIKEKMKQLLKGFQEKAEGGTAPTQTTATTAASSLSSGMLGQLLSLQAGETPADAPTSNNPNSLNGPQNDAGLGPAFFALVDHAAKNNAAERAGFNSTGNGASLRSRRASAAEL